MFYVIVILVVHCLFNVYEAQIHTFINFLGKSKCLFFVAGTYCIQSKLYSFFYLRDMHVTLANCDSLVVDGQVQCYLITYMCLETKSVLKYQYQGTTSIKSHSVRLHRAHTPHCCIALMQQGCHCLYNHKEQKVTCF